MTTPKPNPFGKALDGGTSRRRKAGEMAGGREPRTSTAGPSDGERRIAVDVPTGLYQEVKILARSTRHHRQRDHRRCHRRRSGQETKQVNPMPDEQLHADLRAWADGMYTTEAEPTTYPCLRRHNGRSRRGSKRPTAVPLDRLRDHPGPPRRSVRGRTATAPDRRLDWLELYPASETDW